MWTYLKFFLPVYLLAFFAAGFAWRSYRVWKQTGINPYALGQSDTAHDFIGQLFRLTLLACASVVLLYAFFEAGYRYLTPIGWLEQPQLITLGVGLLIAALVWTIMAQAQMGNAWRIGIDSAHATELVEAGVFRLSRNPVFLGMRMMLLGFSLILPNVATLTILVLGDVLMQIQVRLEEEHLMRLHGDHYRVYCRRVRRWL